MITLKRLKELRRELEAERISLNELFEIEDAFSEIPDSQLSDMRENALASDMLNEIETFIKGEGNAVGAKATV